MTNAHLGPTWGPRAHENPNFQGILLGEVLDSCKLQAVSLSETTSGPSYTYLSGDTSTMVDYIFTDIEAAAFVECCCIHDDTDLNSSDHLPLSVTISCSVPTQFLKDPNWIRIDWAKAEKSGALLDFQKEVSDRLNPYIRRSHGSIDQIDQEIAHAAWLIVDAAQKTLPQLKTKKPHRFKDRILSQLCAKSKEARETWYKEGKPPNGPLYDAKCNMRREVRQRTKFCAAMEERRSVQRRENLFRTNAHLRFRIPQKRGKSQCARLRVDGAIISDPSDLLDAWTHHFC